MIVTTTLDDASRAELQARQAASQLNAAYVPRSRHSLERLHTETGEDHVLVVSERDIRLYIKGQPPLFFHPSMSHVRLKRLMNGEADPMIEAASVQAGDVVLDATAGLGSDAIVFSYAAGPEGRVIATESEPVLAYITEQGLQRYRSAIDELNSAMRRIKVHHASHYEYLRNLEDRSVDIVYFDPMFRHPVKESSAIAPLRDMANIEPISEAAISEAKRVARKHIVLKESRDSGEFERLGFDLPERSPHAKVIYGVIRCE